jgi:hypothetical protein
MHLQRSIRTSANGCKQIHGALLEKVNNEVTSSINRTPGTSSATPSSIYRLTTCRQNKHTCKYKLPSNFVTKKARGKRWSDSQNKLRKMLQKAHILG